VKAADVDQSGLVWIDLVDVNLVAITIAHRNQVRSLSREHETVADIYVVVHSMFDELQLGAAEVVDAETAVCALVGADDQAERRIGRVNPDRGVVGSAARPSLPGRRDVEHIPLRKCAGFSSNRAIHVEPRRVGLVRASDPKVRFAAPNEDQRQQHCQAHTLPSRRRDAREFVLDHRLGAVRPG
jgi:hypothetical protein